MEIGLKIKKQSKNMNTFIIGYANDYSIRYIPTSEVYGEGGYEVRRAKVTKGSDLKLRDASLKLVEILLR